MFDGIDDVIRRAASMPRMVGDRPNPPIKRPPKDGALPRDTKSPSQPTPSTYPKGGK